ncbi:hypothetical protein [Devosia sp.]|uniref:hypothetical protein n=1 Tax=Devosia sp. TaxID=1871048 RepID=UPI00261923FE|nr:hypothetical protein [Devosia sp.]
MSRFGALAFASTAARTFNRPGSDGRSVMGQYIVAQISDDHRAWSEPHPADASADSCIERLRVAGARNASARPR